MIKFEMLQIIGDVLNSLENSLPRLTTECRLDIAVIVFLIIFSGKRGPSLHQTEDIGSNSHYVYPSNMKYVVRQMIEKKVDSANQTS